MTTTTIHDLPESHPLPPPHDHPELMFGGGATRTANTGGDEAPPFVHDSATSKAAADDIVDSATKLRGEVLKFIRACGDKGATDEEIQTALPHIKPNTQRPRRVELAHRRLIADSGEKRPTQSGRSAVVWRVA